MEKKSKAQGELISQIRDILEFREQVIVKSFSFFFFFKTSLSVCKIRGHHPNLQLR